MSVCECMCVRVCVNEQSMTRECECSEAQHCVNGDEGGINNTLVGTDGDRESQSFMAASVLLTPPWSPFTHSITSKKQ